MVDWLGGGGMPTTHKVLVASVFAGFRNLLLFYVILAFPHQPNITFRFVNKPEKQGKYHKEYSAKNVFNTFYVGVEIDHGVKWGYQAASLQTGTYKLCDAPACLS